MIKLENITENDIKQKGVQALANRPNVPAKYGIGSLTPEGLKRHFDQLASFLAEKINKLQNALSGDEAPSHIRLPLFDKKDDEGNTVEGEAGSLADLVTAFANGAFLEILGLPLFDGKDTNGNVAEGRKGRLSDLITSFINGVFAKKFLFLSPSEESEGLETLQGIINDIAASIAALVTGDKLADGAVKAPKLATDAVTTGKIKDENVTASKLAKNSVTTDKIAGENVTTEKLAPRSVTSDILADKSVTEAKLDQLLKERLKSLEGKAFTSVSYNAASGVITFTATDGSTDSIDLPLELIVDDAEFDATAGNEALVLTLANGSTIRVPLENMVSALTGSIEKAVEDAETATNNANTATTKANTAAETAGTEAEKATTAATAATTAAENAERVVSDAAETLEKAKEDFTNFQVIKTIDGGVIRIFVGTQEKYNSIHPSEKADVLCFFTDGTTADEIEADIKELQTKSSSLGDRIGNVEGKVAAHSLAITDFKTQSEARDTTIAALQEKDTLQDTTIAALQEKDALQDVAIANLNSKTATASAAMLKGVANGVQLEFGLYMIVLDNDDSEAPESQSCVLCYRDSRNSNYVGWSSSFHFRVDGTNITAQLRYNGKTKQLEMYRLSTSGFILYDGKLGFAVRAFKIG